MALLIIPKQEPTLAVWQGKHTCRLVPLVG